MTFHIIFSNPLLDPITVWYGFLLLEYIVAAGQNYETEYWENQYVNGITILIDYINVLGHRGWSNSEFVICMDVTHIFLQLAHDF